MPTSIIFLRTCKLWKLEKMRKKTQNCMHKAITDYEKSVIPKQTMQTDDPAASVPLRTLPLSSVGICQWPSPIDGDKASINSRSQF
mmetsp:Transcript_5146/g.7876  ORF Transcript_5146/g.7876 Transcript_5146/m.7876 type:complete len:86 (-) Transcript_5146:180-437(-)